MAGITLAQAQAKLDAWLAAEEGLATSQSYSITAGDSSRSLTRANLREVGERIKYWDAKVKLLSQTRGRTFYVVPE